MINGRSSIKARRTPAFGGNLALTRRAFAAADQAIRGTAIFDLVRRGETALAAQLAQLPVIIDARTARQATETARSIARSSHSSVVLAASFSAHYASYAFEAMDAAHDAIYAADIAAERSHRLTKMQVRHD